MTSSIGLVLSGGGARGAYEVGVLTYLAEHHPDLLAKVRVITGSSVGAVNGVYLASHGLTAESVFELAELWKNLSIDALLSLSSFDALRMIGAAPLRLLRRNARTPTKGLLDAEGLWRLVSRSIDWSGLHRRVQSGRFDAVAVLATDLSSGKSHVFVESRPGIASPADSSEAHFLPVRLGRPHVLASAAIPLLFSPVRVHGRWYIDGGVRNNTPFSAALRLAADGLMIVNVRGANLPLPESTDFPGIGQIVGKLLDAIFLDRVGFDLDRLRRINDFLETAEGLGELERFQRELVARGRPHYRQIPFAVVSPARDLGAVAASYVSGSTRLRSVSFMRVLNALFANDAHTSGDAASFLLFDGEYAKELIATGYQDARAERQSIELLGRSATAQPGEHRS